MHRYRPPHRPPAQPIYPMGSGTFDRVSDYYRDAAQYESGSWRTEPIVTSGTESNHHHVNSVDNGFLYSNASRMNDVRVTAEKLDLSEVKDIVFSEQLKKKLDDQIKSVVEHIVEKTNEVNRERFINSVNANSVEDSVRLLTEAFGNYSFRRFKADAYTSDIKEDNKNNMSNNYPYNHNHFNPYLNPLGQPTQPAQATRTLTDDDINRLIDYVSGIKNLTTNQIDKLDNFVKNLTYACSMEQRTKLTTFVNGLRLNSLAEQLKKVNGAVIQSESAGKEEKMDAKMEEKQYAKKASYEEEEDDYEVDGDESESAVVTTLKQDAKLVAQRIAARKVVNVARDLLVNMLSAGKSKKEANNIKNTIGNLLQTDEGKAVLSFVIGAMLPLIKMQLPEKYHPIAESMAQEFRVEGMVHFGTLLTDFVTGPAFQGAKHLLTSAFDEAMGDSKKTNIRVSVVDKKVEQHSEHEEESSKAVSTHQHHQ